MVLQSSAVAYVSLNSPVRGTETLRATASPALLQLTSDIQRVGTNASHQGCSSTLLFFGNLFFAGYFWLVFFLKGQLK